MPHHAQETPIMQPLSMLPELAFLLAEQTRTAQAMTAALSAAFDIQHMVDAPTVNRVITNYSDMLEFTRKVYPAQIAFWRDSRISKSERLEVDGFVDLVDDTVKALEATLEMARRCANHHTPG